MDLFPGPGLAIQPITTSLLAVPPSPMFPPSIAYEFESSLPNILRSPQKGEALNCWSGIGRQEFDAWLETFNAGDTIAFDALIVCKIEGVFIREHKYHIQVRFQEGLTTVLFSTDTDYNVANKVDFFGQIIPGITGYDMFNRSSLIDLVLSGEGAEKMICLLFDRVTFNSILSKRGPCYNEGYVNTYLNTVVQGSQYFSSIAGEVRTFLNRIPSVDFYKDVFYGTEGLEGIQQKFSSLL